MNVADQIVGSGFSSTELRNKASSIRQNLLTIPGFQVWIETKTTFREHGSVLNHKSRILRVTNGRFDSLTSNRAQWWLFAI
ncbi:hypothetical protein VCRA2121O127_800001 [Vibrio crassostreae]|nr:hypothetical protein VCRA2119O124_730003 [Vibrio crassostreae]CAK3701452.1 hypothetical protein VCRA2120E126_800004 [Vibrio crassostreae]CAK3702094.1 hypothetical protein VCRA2121O127_800001 [Vibrio crassostreae]CAK3918877.1 hypothetical protein VCRA217O17_570001 [Vibrio crassostreae]